MFNEQYTLFGLELVCWQFETSSSFPLERDAYAYIKRLSSANKYRYIRVETIGQDGFPDILMLQGTEYLLNEIKRLKKKRLVSIEDDLEWQFGQLGFAVRSMTMGMSYVLSVCKESKLAIIGQEHTVCHVQKRITRIL